MGFKPGTDKLTDLEATGAVTCLNMVETAAEYWPANQSATALNPVGVSFIVTGNAGGADTFTLAAGTAIGQRKKMTLLTDGGDDAVVTVTTQAWGSGGTGTVTFATEGDWAELMWVNLGSGAKWFPVAGTAVFA